MKNSRKFSSAKVSRYTVCSLLLYDEPYFIVQDGITDGPVAALLVFATGCTAAVFDASGYTATA